MTVRTRGRKYANPDDKPLHPTPMTTAGPQPWHAECIRLRKEEGKLLREIALILGIGKGRIQKFMNPKSKRKAKIRGAKYDKDRRHTDPQYAEKSRDYVRRFMQHNAPKRWKD